MRLLLVTALALTTVSCQSAPKAVEIGMTVHSRGADAAAIERQFDIMATMGVRWVRVDVGWDWIEGERGQFDWSYPDKIVSEATSHGMNVLAVLATTPAWARAPLPEGSEPSAFQRPAQLSDFGAFARLAAERYAPKGVRNWEIWNEPNIPKFWPPAPDVNEYSALFRTTAEAVRNVDPSATLLTGGLSPQFDKLPSEIPPADYLEQLYNNGTAQSADAIAAHPYSFPALPMAPDQRMVGGFKDLPALHAVMERHQDGGKKIWNTEFGAPTGTGQYAVSEEDQAAAISEAREQTQKWDWAGPLIYYELADGGSDPAEIEENFGVLHEDLRPKPAGDRLVQDASDGQD